MINAPGSTLATALSGMQAAARKVEGAAANIASPAQHERLIEDVVDLKLGEVSYKANAAVIRTTQEMSQEMLRLFDKKV